jgi:GDP-4-dehydro-6-deoxy-D-mannose reductase
MEVGNLTTERAFLDVQDTVRGFYLAALKGKPGESYNLCATKTSRIGDMLEMAIRLSGVEVKVQPVKRLMRPSDERIIFGDTKKIRRDTGWKPLQTLEQTLTSMLEHWERVL